MTNQNQLRRLAVLNVLHKRIGAEIAAQKKEIGGFLGRGSMTAFADQADPASTELGTLSMSRPRQGAPRIVDETAAMVWLLDAFGDDETLVEVRLSEQGRKSVIAAHKSGHDVPGVQTPAPGDPVVSFRQSDDAEAAIVSLWERGELDLDAILAIEPADPKAEQ